MVLEGRGLQPSIESNPMEKEKLRQEMAPCPYSTLERFQVAGVRLQVFP
jgi:hypothetical protein